MFCCNNVSMRIKQPRPTDHFVLMLDIRQILCFKSRLFLRSSTNHADNTDDT